MGISPFLSLIYQVQNTIYAEKFCSIQHKDGGSVVKFLPFMWEAGVQFPALVKKAFSFVSSQ